MGDKMKLFHREHKIENHEEKEMFFSFCVEQIYPHKQGELFVLGTVDGKRTRIDVFNRSLWL